MEGYGTELKSDEMRPSKSFLDILSERLDGAISRPGLARIRRFAAGKNVDKWIVASDYCVGEKTRPNDSFAFTLYPAGDRYEETLAKLQKMTQRDLKEVKRIPANIIRGLRSSDFLSIALVVDRDRRLFTGIEEARANLDASLDMMATWDETQGVKAAIKDLSGLRREFERKSASLALLTNIILVSSVAAYISALLCEASAAKAILWAPDRDAITTSYRGVAYSFYNVNLSALCAKIGAEAPNPVGIMTGDNPLLDTLISIAGLCGWRRCRLRPS